MEPVIQTKLDDALAAFRYGPRCGFCKGLKNKERGYTFVCLERLGASQDTIRQLKQEVCDCWKGI